MNNISDKYALIIIISTIFIVFSFIFSVKSPERKLIESPIIWKDNISNISYIDKAQVRFFNNLYL